MKQKWNRNIRIKKRYLAILLSYLLILMIPLVCGIFLHIYNRELVTEQSEDMTKRMLSHVQDQVDAYMEKTWQMALVASQMESVDRVLNTDHREEADLAYELYLVGKELQMFYAEPSVKDLFIYFPGLDRVVGQQGTMDSDMYCKLFFDGTIEGANFRNELDRFHYQDCVKVEKENGESDILCIISDPSVFRTEESRYVVAVVFEEKVLKELLESNCWVEEAAIFVQTREGELLSQTDDFENAEILSKFQAGEEQNQGFQEIIWKNVSYEGMEKESPLTKQKYFMLTPRDVIERNVSKMQQVYLFMLFGCLFIGVGTAGLLSKKHYHPMKILSYLISQFKSQNENTDIPNGEDEYLWLQKQADHFFRERVNTMQIMKRNRKTLKNYYLLRLLENSYTEELEQKLMENGIIFRHSQFVAIQFVTDKKEVNPEEKALLLFIIKNIFTELVEETEELTLYMVQMGERMVAVINFDYPAMEQIQDKIQRTQDMIEEKFCQQVIALVGNSYGSQREIFKSYEDTCELEDYISILEERIICYQDIQGRQQTYRYDAQMSQKLFNAIKAGNRDIAVEQVKDILGQYRQKDVAFGVYRSLLFDILGTILRAADAGGYHELMEDSIQVEALLSNLTLKRMERTFTELLGMACQRISSLQQGAGPGSELSCKVEKYVLENFRDPDLNISQTGLHFQMSPSYLSSIYKKQTGGSLLEFINSVRIREAEHLLEQGMSVTEVAERAGFRDSTYLIRVFKKKKGMTPGQKKANL